MDNLLEDIPATPEKFLDKETGGIRADALLKSYLELEKKLAASNDPSKFDRKKILGFLGVPEKPEDYAIAISHDMFTEDDAINAKLFEKGFTQEQAQFLYDLAAEYMVPLVLDIAREFEAERQLEKLVEAFGGKERYAEVSRQLLAYGRKNLPADVLEGLAGSFEGVMALYRIMQSNKPLSIQAPVADEALDPVALRAMMKNPKYWREKDPAFIKKVSDGFRQVFAEQQ
jgi:hypothetical protein